MTNKTFTKRFQNKFISWIDYGAPDEEQRAGTPVTVDVLEDFFWSFNSGGIRLGEVENGLGLAYSFQEDPNQSLNGADVYTILDSGSTEVLISELWYESFTEQLFG